MNNGNGISRSTLFIGRWSNISSPLRMINESSEDSIKSIVLVTHYSARVNFDMDECVCVRYRLAGLSFYLFQPFFIAYISFYLLVDIPQIVGQRKMFPLNFICAGKKIKWLNFMHRLEKMCGMAEPDGKYFRLIKASGRWQQ